MNSIRQPSVAEMVASVLRNQIVSGSLEDGSFLPTQDELLSTFRVSKSSLREALRVLEAERLITVRRGSQGGAVVHVPRAANAAYMISLVLEHQRVSYADVGAAMSELEPLCASLLAKRPDRNDTAVPALERLHKRAYEAADDEVEWVRLQRAFHEEVVANCGNATVILLVGALEALWSGKQVIWARTHDRAGEALGTADHRREGMHHHEAILKALRSGDADAAREAMRAHVELSNRSTAFPTDVVHAPWLRSEATIVDFSARDSA